MLRKNKNNIENCWEQFSMFTGKKICCMHTLNTKCILAYLFLQVNYNEITNVLKKGNA